MTHSHDDVARLTFGCNACIAKRGPMLSARQATFAKLQTQIKQLDSYRVDIADLCTKIEEELDALRDALYDYAERTGYQDE